MQPFINFYTVLEQNKRTFRDLQQQLLGQMARVFYQDNFHIKKLDHISVSSADKKKEQKGNTKIRAFNFERKKYQKLSMPICHFDSYNLWLLKPTHLNRGRGIHVFRDLETLHKLIK
jgi:hypothetical protein